MANSATIGALRVLLSADTAQFDKAMSGADASTKKLANTMKRDLEPSQARINSLIRQFEGTQAKGAAEAYAQAIAAVGGATKLTAQHQEQANASVQKALAHYKALGQQAPAHLLELEKATRKIEAPTAALGSNIDMVGGKVKALAGMFGVTLGAAAIGGFIHSTFVAAEQVVDLSEKMGVSIEAAQRFKFAANQSGAEIDDVSRAIVKMNDNLATGDKSTVTALDDVGLKFADVRAMKPEQAFRAVADAVAGIADPMKQTQVVMELFGKSGVEILGMIRSGALKAADGITVMSTEAAKRLEAAKQDWDNWIASLTIGSAEGISAVLRLKSAFGALADQLSSFKGAWDFTKFMATAVAKGNTPQMALIAQLLAAEVKANPTAPTDVNPPGPPPKKTNELTDAQKKYNDEIQRGADLLTGKAMAAHVKQLADEVSRAGGESKIATPQLKKLREELDDLWMSGAKLPPVLDKIRLSGSVDFSGNSSISKEFKDANAEIQKMLGSINHFQVAWGDTFTGDLMGDFMKGAKPLVDFQSGDFAPEWVKAASRMFDVQPASATKSIGAASTMIQVLNHNLANSSQLMNAIAGSASGSFRTVSKVVSNAADSFFSYSSAMKAAKVAQDSTAMSAAQMGMTMNVASFGIGMVINSLNQAAAEEEAFRQKMKALREEAKALGVTWEEIERIRKNAIDSGPGGFWSLSKENILKILQDAKTKLDDLTSSAEKFGGVLPKSLQDAAKQMLGMGALTGDLRKQLEKLIGQPSWQVVEERASALGIDKNALGPGFNQAKTKDLALGFVRDITLFTDAGADVDGVLRGMSDELSALLVEARKTGAALPKTLEPYLKKLSEMGLLLDENGNAIEMGAFSFQDFEDEALEAMKDLLTEIKDILAKAFPAAADAAAKAIGKIGEAFKWPSSGGVGKPTTPMTPDDWTAIGMTPPDAWLHDANIGGSFDGSVGLSQQQQTSTFIFSFDERALARSTVSYIPGETKRLGLNRV